MPRRKTLSDRQIKALSRDRRHVIADPELGSHYLRVPAGDGPVVYTVVVKKGGKQTWEVVGNSNDMGIATAREKARAVIARIRSGTPPPRPPQSVTAVCEDWINRHVVKTKLRTEQEVRRIVSRYIAPSRIGGMDFIKLRRSDIVHLIDQIEDASGPHQADAVLALLRRVANWVQWRSDDDDYQPPFSRNMTRASKQQRIRTRVLSDDELRTVWLAADDAGVLGEVIKLLLLTCQRRQRVYDMRWSDISGDIWTVPFEAGQKGVGGRLKLPAQALSVLNDQPRISDRVFPHLFSMSSKVAFEKSCGVSFRLHDARRTARTLLSRLGVPFEVSESLLGHKLKGVASVYAQYDHESQKGVALARLASLIEQIVYRHDNVVPLVS
jgi:integrase